ncbi:hypothetical protein FACS1894139_05830 [Planctomycetales bacterium]|nr:hypothetical protein FACS1894107_05350 [Planctomycetales bacterium]GHS97621.1 hypothetical protein FACS1894108_04320 [Planctomycetales bacterium]GHT04155.1 hypothetical protein FACS1894139_05830 [Planctomycetales bacterium]
MTKKLIINADDLGLSRAVSRGIETAHRQGAVTSASLLVNFPAFAAGVRVARDNPRLGVGVHLNIIRGAPTIAPEKVKPLLGDDGNFTGNFWEIGRRGKSAEFLAAAAAEYRAQIEKALAAGVAIDHLDFEKHHGVWRPLYEIGRQLAAEYRVGLRVYREPLFFVWRHLSFPTAGALAASARLWLYQRYAHRQRGADAVNYFFGQSHIGRLDEKFMLALIANCPVGVSELMCHPGLRDADEETALAPLVGKTWITAQRDRELAALTARDWRAVAGEYGVALGKFGE